MSQIEEKEEELKIKVEYGIATPVYSPFRVPKKGGGHTVKFEKDISVSHRSGRRTGFLIPEPFKKLLLPKMKFGKNHKCVDFAMATHRYEMPREVFNILYAIAIKHKSDNFNRKVGRKIVTGRIKRYLKDAYRSYKGYTFENEYGDKMFFKWKMPRFIYIEQEVVA